MPRQVQKQPPFLLAYLSVLLAVVLLGSNFINNFSTIYPLDLDEWSEMEKNLEKEIENTKEVKDFSDFAKKCVQLSSFLGVKVSKINVEMTFYGFNNHAPEIPSPPPELKGDLLSCC